MAKRLKLSSLQLEDLPNEVLLKVLSYVEIRDLICCGQISKRIRTISHDESLWQKLNLCKREIPTEFLEFVINNGCKYLSISYCKLVGVFPLSILSQLKYLDLETSKFKRTARRTAQELLKFHVK